MKWTGTVICLIGILFTSVNYYPSNLFFGFTGSLLWALAGLRQKDYALFIVEFVAVLMYLYGIMIL